MGNRTTMNERAFIDPAIQRKSEIVDRALTTGPEAIPLPSVVEVSESGTCNRSCVFCPRSAPDFPDVKEFIDPALIDSVSSQLEDVGFAGIFLFSGFVEPLLDKKICDHVKTVRRNLSHGRIEIVTNGDVLNEKRLRQLFDAGLNTLLISVYDGPEDAARFDAMCRSIGLRDDQFVIRHRYLPPEEDFGITLSNRAGMMEGAKFAIPATREAGQGACYYPHYTFFFDYQGDVLMCPHDWGKKRVVGNLTRQSFKEIWTGSLFETARQRLRHGDRNFSPCNVCDVKGAIMGKRHVEAWESYWDNTSAEPVTDR
jgi:radical SAM protein with 4Fe4S-binding SPASM domain